MARVVVIGAGAMGLAASYHVCREGHAVEVTEACAEPRGMAAHFDFDGLSIGRFCHFLCKTDAPTFALLRVLSIADALRWRPTSMGYFDGAMLHSWGDPVSLLRFPMISLISRPRYGLFAFVCTQRERWDAIEHETAQSWITRWRGTEVYKTFWPPLFDLEFYEYASDTSTAWIWSWIKRIGRSRRSLFQGELGYLEGGSLTLIGRLCDAIREAGGTITLRRPALRVRTEDGRVTGVETPTGTIPAEAVSCTVPPPLVPNPHPQSSRGVATTLRGDRQYRRPLPRLPAEAAGLSLSLDQHRRAERGHPGIDRVLEPAAHRRIGGVHPVLHASDASEIRLVGPGAAGRGIRHRPASEPGAHPGRRRGLAGRPPTLRAAGSRAGLRGQDHPVETPIRGLQVAHTCFYYLKDRGISESVRFGREMAARLAA